MEICLVIAYNSIPWYWTAVTAKRYLETRTYFKFVHGKWFSPAFSFVAHYLIAVTMFCGIAV